MNLLDFDETRRRLERIAARCTEPCVKCGALLHPESPLDCEGARTCGKCRAKKPLTDFDLYVLHSRIGIPRKFRAPWNPISTGEDSAALAWDWKTSAVLIQGMRGSGKSHLAATLAMNLALTGRVGTWAPAASIPMADYARREQWLSAPVLVIDDLGLGMGTEFGWGAVAAIAAPRWDDDLPTIYTTALSELQIAERDASIYDRLFPGALLVELPGGSRR